MRRGVLGVEKLTALSRKSRCSFESGFLRLVFGGFERDSGEGSDEGGADEVVIEACWVRREAEKEKLGRRKSGIERRGWMLNR